MSYPMTILHTFPIGKYLSVKTIYWILRFQTNRDIFECFSGTKLSVVVTIGVVLLPPFCWLLQKRP